MVRQKGNSLLGAFVRFRRTADGPIESFYVDTAFVGRKQNAGQVQIGLENLIPYIKAQLPSINTIVLVSDNGSAFSNNDNLVYVFERNHVSWGCAVVVSDWYFFEAQCGKTKLDTHFSFINFLLKRSRARYAR